MDTVWKFPIGYGDGPIFDIEVPAGAVPLTVNFDPDGALVLWARVDASELRRKTLTVTVVETGRQLPAGTGDYYLSTFLTGPFVFHAFVGARQ